MGVAVHALVVYLLVVEQGQGQGQGILSILGGRGGALVRVASIGGAYAYL